MHIRPAKAGESAILTALVLRSKAHWGYDQHFMDACRAELTLTEVDLLRREFWVAEHDGAPVGVVEVTVDGTSGEIEKLFVDPAAMGLGVGRCLMEAALEKLREAGAISVTVASDPQAAPFYERMGFELVGTVPSGSIAGRSLPQLARPIATGADRP